MSSRTDLKTVDSWSDEVALCSSVIKSLGGPLEILEAGCGSNGQSIWMASIIG